MAVTSTPIFAQTPFVKSLNMSAITACTTRGPTATASLAGANITAFVPISTNGLRIDSIGVTAASTGFTVASVANIVGIWAWDGFCVVCLGFSDNNGGWRGFGRDCLRWSLLK